MAILTGGLPQSLPCGVLPAVGSFLAVATTRPLPSAVRRGPLPPLLPTQAMPIYFLVGRLPEPNCDPLPLGQATLKRRVTFPQTYGLLGATYVCCYLQPHGNLSTSVT